MKGSAAVTRRVERRRGGTAEIVDDVLVVEAPLEIALDTVPIAVLMRTPGTDVALATGFALTEGIVLRPGELAAVDPIGGPEEEGRIALRLAQGVHVDPERFRRNLFATSSCGVCGKASIDAVRITTSGPRRVRITERMLTSLPEQMRSGQEAFARTGALHAAALFDETGKLISLEEDVGRHNAVDKVVGRVAPDLWPVAPIALMVSGRVSFEIVQKAAVAGIGFVAGVSAPSSLAVELADELSMTVVGFLRGDDFNVYCGSVAP